MYLAGGVISPLRPIECRLSGSSGITPAPTQEAVTHLPTSIPVGSTKVVPGGIRANLALPSLPPSQLTVPYQREEFVGLKSVMPWTNLPIENFEFRKAITLQFPVAIREVRTPNSVTTGCRSVIEWEVSCRQHNQHFNLTWLGFQQEYSTAGQVKGL